MTGETSHTEVALSLLCGGLFRLAQVLKSTHVNKSDTVKGLVWDFVARFHQISLKATLCCYLGVRYAL